MAAVLEPSPAPHPVRVVGDEPLDPFRAPSRRVPIGGARPRDLVVVEGDVVHVTCRAWTGGPTLEVTIVDDTGSLVLAFLGRRRVGGLEPGRRLVAAGRLVDHHRGRLVLDPHLWLDGQVCEGAGGAPGTSNRSSSV